MGEGKRGGDSAELYCGYSVVISAEVIVLQGYSVPFRLRLVWSVYLHFWLNVSEKVGFFFALSCHGFPYPRRSDSKINTNQTNLPECNASPSRFNLRPCFCSNFELSLRRRSP